MDARRKKSLAFLVLIGAAAILGAFFVFPKGLGKNILPWRLGLDLVGGSHLVYEVDMANVAEADRDSVMSGLRFVIETRVNKFGVSEPQVVTAKSGESHRLLVELAGVKDVNAAIRMIGETPFLLFAEVEEIPAAPGGAATGTPEHRFKATELTGRYVKGAQVTFDQIGKPQISLEFNEEGASLFEQITERNVGRPVAIFIDDEGAFAPENLISAPVVQEKISGGRAQVTGDFNLNEAKLFVARFNAGALPAPITLISQQTVGATLGIGSFQKTLWAGAVGTLLIILFMVIYYGRFGFFASLALLIYIVLTLSIFKLFAVTMTLAGIAGIILSIGMAVDANVLIFERTREEERRGIPEQSAVEEGFRRAWLSIRDSNVTTMISSVILYYFTSGFIKGFALALFVGVVISMFSAITVTRNIMRVFVK